MYAPTGTITPPGSPRIPPRSILIRLLVRHYDYRRPRFWVGLRLTCAIWNLALGLLLVSSGHWLGQYAWLGLLSLAGSALLFATVAHLRRFMRGEAVAIAGTSAVPADDR